jgi:1,4-dihydroxy-6-naphthoate synthase
MPVPLAAICARADVGAELRSAVEDALRRSVEHAFAHPLDSLEYVRAHSQEMSDEVCRRHIDLYVNEFSIDLGDDGMAAVDALLARAVESPA